MCSTADGVVEGMAMSDPYQTCVPQEEPSPKRSPGREGLRVVLSSTSFVASFFWLMVILSAMLFVFPYSENLDSLPFYVFMGLAITVFFGYRYFPYDGYHPLIYGILLLATDALIALMIFLAGGGESALAWLYPCVLLFSSAYLGWWGTVLVSLATALAFISPIFYQDLSPATIKGMFVAVPSFFLVAICGHFLMKKAREEEREKLMLTELYSRADTHRRELSVLYTVSVKLAATLSEEDILDIVADKVNELVRHDAMLLCAYQEGKLFPRRQKGIDPMLLEALTDGSDESPLCMAAEAVLPVLLNRGEDPNFPREASRHGYRSLLSAPLYASEKTLGAICLFSREEGDFDDDAARLLLTLCSEAAAALEKARLYRRTLEEKGKVEAIIEGLNDGLLVLDTFGKVIMANPSAQKIFESQDDLLGTPVDLLFDNVAGSCRPHPGDAFREALEKGQALSGKWEKEKPDSRHFQVSWIPLREGMRGSLGVAVILHDVTDFVELDRLKDDFISIVSHELRTPLTSIKGFLRLLQAERVGPLNDKQRRYLETVLEQTDGLISLVGDLLDLSRMEAGKIKVEKRPEDLGELVGGVLEGMEGLLAQKGLELRIRMEKGLPTVWVDKERMRQVLVNLLHNAVKFTPAGGKITVGAEKGSPGKVRLWVADTGPGIPPKDLERVFDKFYQVDPSSTRHQTGAGLGLSICKKLVEAMDGKIWAESDGRTGTVLKVELTEAEEVNPFHGEGSGSRGVLFEGNNIPHNVGRSSTH